MQANSKPSWPKSRQAWHRKKMSKPRKLEENLKSLVSTDLFDRRDSIVIRSPCEKPIMYIINKLRSRLTLYYNIMYTYSDWYERAYKGVTWCHAPQSKHIKSNSVHFISFKYGLKFVKQIIYWGIIKFVQLNIDLRAKLGIFSVPKCFNLNSIYKNKGKSNSNEINFPT